MDLWRWNLHAVIASTAMLTVALGWQEPPWQTHPAPPDAPVVASSVLARPEPLVPVLVAADTSEVLAPVAEAAPAVEPPRERLLIEQVTVHRVRPGETLKRIAERAGISVETLQWANSLRDINHLEVGQELTVLPVSGVLHTFRADEDVPSLAERYGIALERIVEANGLVEPYNLRAGEKLLIPDGRPLRANRGVRPTLDPGANSPIERPEGAVPWPAPGTGDRFKEQFIAAAVPGAQESQRRTRVPASVIIAQAIHESYWGTSKLAREANNYFGIKARNGAGSAGVYWMDAWEVIGGQDVVTPEPFRAYHSPDDSFVDHGLFFHQNPRYHGAFNHTHDARAFALAIADAGYATDPAYARKLIGIMEQYNLMQYDLP